eukprot:scaffold9114_cov66-Phaeocystis_antarctica.AAC.4
MPLTVSTDSAAYCASVPTRFRSRVSSRSSMPQTAMVAAVTKESQRPSPATPRTPARCLGSRHTAGETAVCRSAVPSTRTQRPWDGCALASASRLLDQSPLWRPGPTYERRDESCWLHVAWLQLQSGDDGAQRKVRGARPDRRLRTAVSSAGRAESLGLQGRIIIASRYTAPLCLGVRDPASRAARISSLLPLSQEAEEPRASRAPEQSANVQAPSRGGCITRTRMRRPV